MMAVLVSDIFATDNDNGIFSTAISTSSLTPAEGRRKSEGIDEEIQIPSKSRCHRLM
jgi:hypothetical protein